MNRQFATVFCAAFLVVACSSAPPNPAPVALNDIKGVRDQLDEYIRHEVSQYKVAGLSIALVDDQKIVWAQGFGWADAVARVPAGPDTRYRVGSISKLLTDTAAMQLVADGRLDLDAPVQKTLPWFHIGSAWPNSGVMTLRQLLTHHAGLPHDVGGGMWVKAAPTPQHDFRAMLHTLADTQVDAPPGHVMSYSNVGIDVVGAMIEAASKQPFEQRIQEAVLAPLGMRDAQFSAAVPTDPTMARAHFKMEPKNELALRDVPAGGLNASVNDLAHFLMMQFAGGRNREGAVVLPAAQQAAMLERQYPGQPLDEDLQVGLGWMLMTFGTDSVRGGGPVAHHSGATMYFRSKVMMLPERKVGVVVLSNDSAADEVVSHVAQRALALLLESRHGIRQTPIEPGFVPAAQAWTDAQRRDVQTACAGDYVTLAGPAALRAKGAGLVAELDNRQFEVREGEAGRLGLRYRLGGLLPLELGPLSEMGFECAQVEGRHVLRAILGGQRVLVGEKLPPPALPADFSRWTGRYRPQLLEGEVDLTEPSGDVRVFQADGRMWAEYEGTGGSKVRILLHPVSDKTWRIIGPLADMGPVVQLESGTGGAPRFRYTGWTFDRVGE